MQAWNTCFGKSSASSQARAEMQSTLHGMFGISTVHSTAAPNTPTSEPAWLWVVQSTLLRSLAGPRSCITELGGFKSFGSFCMTQAGTACNAEALGQSGQPSPCVICDIV